MDEYNYIQKLSVTWIKRTPFTRFSSIGQEKNQNQNIGGDEMNLIISRQFENS